MLLFLTSCGTPYKPKVSIPYILSSNPIKCKDTTIACVPIFYGAHNFILYNDSTIYYHTYKPDLIFCGTGIDSSKPPYIGLVPEGLTLVKIKDLKSFCKKHVDPDLKDDNNLILILSPKKIIWNKALPLLYYHFKNEVKMRTGIHNCTEEQIYVSRAKFSKKEYNPKEIKWEIGFDSYYSIPALEMIKP